MKIFIIVVSVLLFFGGLSFIFGGRVERNKPIGTQLNSDSKPQYESSLIYAVYSEKHIDVVVIENCEYMKNINGKPPVANTNYVHKGNCRNPIHPQNYKFWLKLETLLNSPMLNKAVQ